MRNLLAGFALPLILTGCGLPPLITVASTVADGLSYAISGKGVSDHALSAITTRDCAVLRLLDGRELCVEYGQDEATVLLAEVPGHDTWAPVDDLPPKVAAVPSLNVEAPRATANASLSETQAKTRFSDAIPVSKSNLERPAATHALSSSGVFTVTVLASYRDRANAERALPRLEALMPRIAVFETGTGPLFRIVSDASVGQARETGIADAWPLKPKIRQAASL